MLTMYDNVDEDEIDDDGSDDGESAYDDAEYATHYWLKRAWCPQAMGQTSVGGNNNIHQATGETSATPSAAALSQMITHYISTPCACHHQITSVLTWAMQPRDATRKLPTL